MLADIGIFVANALLWSTDTYLEEKGSTGNRQLEHQMAQKLEFGTLKLANFHMGQSQFSSLKTGDYVELNLVNNDVELIFKGAPIGEVDRNYHRFF